MSTTEDFENAPIGATATSPDGRKVYRRETKTLVGADWVREEGDAYTRIWADADGLANFGYILGPPPSPTPTTARGALDLAWELAHPVKEGQIVTEGSEYIERSDRGFYSHHVKTSECFPMDSWDVDHVRTLDPLPDPEPEPDWLDAPAVVAFVKGQVSCVNPQVFARANKTGTQEPHDGYWRSSLTGLHYRWDELIDVTPLYPKDES